MKITAHVMVKNEYKFLWYSVMSVIHHVDKVLLWDTGSTDGTVDIIKEILKSQEAKETEVVFESYPSSQFDEELFRQKMLDKTNTEWFIVVDGDEIWWEDSIKKITNIIRSEGHKYESIVIPTVNTVGDIFHYQEEKAGNYKLAGRVGHYNLRGVNRSIPGLHSKGAHGVWGWADENGNQIQDRSKSKVLFIDAPYLHCTFLERAKQRQFDEGVLKRKQKLKHEIGIQFPNDYYYPEVLFKNKPNIIPNVWETMSPNFYIKSTIQTPLRKIKRRVLPKKIGY